MKIIIVFLFGILALSQVQPKELQWNRYVTANFEILSLDDSQGKYLYNNIEFIKTWVLWRWGMKDIELSSKCKIICVPSVDLYEKLFNKQSSSWSAEQEYVIWMITDGKKWNTKLPVYLTEIVLRNFEKKYNVEIPTWCHRGMSILNGRIDDVRLKVNTGVFASATLLTENYSKLSDNQKNNYDAESALFCLWIKKEYGNKIFLKYINDSSSNPEYYLQYFGVKTYSECDQRVKQYSKQLINGSDGLFTW